MASSESLPFSSLLVPLTTVNMTTRDLLWWWPSLDPLLWHRRAALSENSLSPEAGTHQWQEVKALHCLWEPCLRFNLNVQGHEQILLPVGTALLRELGLPGTSFSCQVLWPLQSSDAEGAGREERRAEGSAQHRFPPHCALCVCHTARAALSLAGVLLSPASLRTGIAGLSEVPLLLAVPGTPGTLTCTTRWGEEQHNLVLASPS